ncbi:M16 family metallopeptidase [candidate division KSB1 bacterium]
MTFEYNKTTLPNGIRVVSEYMPHVRSVTLGAWINTGSRDETAESSGICHFMEHLVFKGTEKRSTVQIAESLESVGGNLNAFTGKEVTCYYAHVLDEHTELAADVLSDLIGNAVLKEDDIIKEKQVVLEEINSLEDTPDELIHDLFQQNVFTGHSLEYSILGTKETLQNFDKSALSDFRDKYYSSKNTVVAAAGNIQHNELVAIVEKYFTLSPGICNKRENGELVQKPRETEVSRNISQAHICIGNTSLAYSDSRKYGLLLLHTILGGGMSSRLFQNIREKYGVAYSIYSFVDFFIDTGLFGVYVAVEKSNIEKSIALIRSEFEIASTKPVGNQELERFKSQLKGNIMLGLENTYSRMNRLAKMELNLNLYVTLDEVLEAIDTVKPEDIAQIAHELLSGKLFMSAIMPE